MGQDPYRGCLDQPFSRAASVVHVADQVKPFHWHKLYTKYYQVSLSVTVMSTKKERVLHVELPQTFSLA